ncbi:GNAT family N-acetyltransferase [Catalinimonas niigatensis]|uniref:GNAT family N-acetyltransferase n=1 Tax=Catalinimonas niigatensis TaxID=1397264 RepID=UPI002666FA5E|nr:GNAT family N-acetyltransferase [Catalinimonas niigatensis]WPP53008.1 GNAT family N-acetyltransferase [Catalinimonas niigatensis]
MNISYPLAQAEDLKKILEMMEDFYGIDAYPFDKLLTAANLKQFVANPNLGRLWLITSDRETLGYLVLTFGYSFEFKGRDAFLDEFYLKEAYRSQGIGSQAIDFVLEQAKALGIQAVHLEVERHNEKGTRLYRSKGFKEHKRTLMTKWLS